MKTRIFITTIGVITIICLAVSCIHSQRKNEEKSRIDYPSITLSNGLIKANVLLPDAKKAFIVAPGSTGQA